MSASNEELPTRPDQAQAYYLPRPNSFETCEAHFKGNARSSDTYMLAWGGVFFYDQVIAMVPPPHSSHRMAYSHEPPLENEAELSCCASDLRCRIPILKKQCRLQHLDLGFFVACRHNLTIRSLKDFIPYVLRSVEN